MKKHSSPKHQTTSGHLNKSQGPEKLMGSRKKPSRKRQFQTNWVATTVLEIGIFNSIRVELKAK